MAYCEELGFDGVVFNEPHYCAYGTMPSPNLIASALSQKTKKIKIGVLGNILPLRNHPVRVAEEYAMIDCLSNGRLIAGFVRGIPPEYIWYGVNPGESRGRFQEAYDLIMTAWTESVWSFEGEFCDPAMRYFFTVFNRGFNEAINKGAVDQKLTAALTSERSFSYFREGNRERHDFSKLDWQGLIDSGYLIAGNPDSVAKQIQSQ